MHQPCNSDSIRIPMLSNSGRAHEGIPNSNALTMQFEFGTNSLGGLRGEPARKAGGIGTRLARTDPDRIVLACGFGARCDHDRISMIEEDD